VDDRRQRFEQHGRMTAGKGEASADQEDLTPAVVNRDVVACCGLYHRLGIARRERRIGSQYEAAPAVQQKTVAFVEADRLVAAFGYPPACPPQDGGELDAFVGGEEKRPGSRRVEPGAELAARLQ
jgi:hypothetical protein